MPDDAPATQFVHRFRLAPEPALTLAALRVLAPLMILLAPGFREGPRVARWDGARWVVPEGLSWFVAHVPISGGLATAAQIVVTFAALLAAAGIYARLALAILAVATFYLFSIAQLGGHVWHDMHLLWFVALLAASPCDDVLAVDARRPLFAEGTAYAGPLFIVRILLSAIYFFPGLHKLVRSGLAWALSDNVRNQMYWKWAEHGVVPALRLDEVPWLLEAGGLLVLAFELGFPLLVLWRRTRPLAAALGVVFHVFTQAVFLIPFASLWGCYVALIDWRPLVRRLGLVGDPEGAVAPGVRRKDKVALATVGGWLVVGALVQGARGQMRAYPFACYPTFEWRVGAKMPDLQIALFRPGAQEVEVPARTRPRTQREWAEVWTLVGATSPMSTERLRAYYAAIRERDPAVAQAAEAADSVRFYRVARSVLPADQGRIVDRALLLEIPAAR
jgi:hypothetical protein